MTDYNASERKDVRRAEKESALWESQRREIISGIMSVSPGRRWVLETLEAYHVFATSFSTSALQMAFSEGERNAGLRLLNDIMWACPNQYTEMMKERNERDSSGRSSRNRADGNGRAGGSSGEASLEFEHDRIDEGYDDRDEAGSQA